MTQTDIGFAVVDGVAYTEARLRQIIQERHQLAHEVYNLRDSETALKMDLALWRGYAERRQVEIEQLKVRLDRADRHLRLRTSALARLIARKGPNLPERRGW